MHDSIMRACTLTSPFYTVPVPRAQDSLTRPKPHRARAFTEPIPLLSLTIQMMTFFLMNVFEADLNQLPCLFDNIMGRARIADLNL